MRAISCLFLLALPLAAQEKSAETRDVSARGICFYLDSAIATGSPIEFTLTLPPEITLTESIRVRCKGKVVRVSEGDAPIVECLSGNPNACRISSSCRLKGVLVDAFDTLYAALNEHTLADLVEKPRALTQALTRR